ncbi:MAG: hypothetical protein CMJ64_10650 [Planctomycetaceae bacterium]|nr:hypothetical protein [Planctomycetaceae bacterium]
MPGSAPPASTSSFPTRTLRYRSAEKIDYTNAAPVLHDGKVYLQGVWGELHCVNLEDGAVVWKTNLLEAFDAEPLTWGYSVPPLVVDEKLIVAPGAKDVSIAALDLKTGEVIWKTPGHAPLIRRSSRRQSVEWVRSSVMTSPVSAVGTPRPVGGCGRWSRQADRIFTWEHRWTSAAEFLWRPRITPRGCTASPTAASATHRSPSMMILLPTLVRQSL